MNSLIKNVTIKGIHKQVLTKNATKGNQLTNNFSTVEKFCRRPTSVPPLKRRVWGDTINYYPPRSVPSNCPRPRSGGGLLEPNERRSFSIMSCQRNFTPMLNNDIRCFGRIHNFLENLFGNKQTDDSVRTETRPQEKTPKNYYPRPIFLDKPKNSPSENSVSFKKCKSTKIISKIPRRSKSYSVLDVPEAVRKNVLSKKESASILLKEEINRVKLSVAKLAELNARIREKIRRGIAPLIKQNSGVKNYVNCSKSLSRLNKNDNIKCNRLTKSVSRVNDVPNKTQNSFYLKANRAKLAWKTDDVERSCKNHDNKVKVDCIESSIGKIDLNKCNSKRLHQMANIKQDSFEKELACQSNNVTATMPPVKVSKAVSDKSEQLKNNTSKIAKDIKKASVVKIQSKFSREPNILTKQDKKPDFFCVKRQALNQLAGLTDAKKPSAIPVRMGTKKIVKSSNMKVDILNANLLCGHVFSTPPSRPHRIKSLLKGKPLEGPCASDLNLLSTIIEGSKTFNLLSTMSCFDNESKAPPPNFTVPSPSTGKELMLASRNKRRGGCPSKTSSCPNKQTPCPKKVTKKPPPVCKIPQSRDPNLKPVASTPKSAITNTTTCKKPNLKMCPNCKALVNDDMKVCPKCYNLKRIYKTPSNLINKPVQKRTKTCTSNNLVVQACRIVSVQSIGEIKENLVPTPPPDDMILAPCKSKVCVTSKAEQAYQTETKDNKKIPVPKIIKRDPADLKHFEWKAVPININEKINCAKLQDVKKNSTAPKPSFIDEERSRDYKSVFQKIGLLEESRKTQEQERKKRKLEEEKRKLMKMCKIKK